MLMPQSLSPSLPGMESHVFRKTTAGRYQHGQCGVQKNRWKNHPWLNQCLPLLLARNSHCSGIEHFLSSTGKKMGNLTHGTAKKFPVSAKLFLGHFSSGNSCNNSHSSLWCSEMVHFLFYFRVNGFVTFPRSLFLYSLSTGDPMKHLQKATEEGTVT